MVTCHRIARGLHSDAETAPAEVISYPLEASQSRRGRSLSHRICRGRHIGHARHGRDSSDRAERIAIADPAHIDPAHADLDRTGRGPAGRRDRPSGCRGGRGGGPRRAAPPAAARPAAAPPAAVTAAPTVVSFTFDNQWESQMIAAADLKAAGMAGTFYTISGWIGLSGFQSMSDLQTLVADGDEIGGKTVNNSDLPTLSNAEAEREICQGRDVLLADGFKVTDFAYPFADLNAEDETLVKACGFNSGRGVGNVASVDPGACSYPDCPYAETIPPADPYQINTPDDAEQTTTLVGMEQTVTNAETHGGGLLAFSFHQICDTTTAGCDPVYSWSPELFSQFLTWLKGQEATGGVQVKTIAQVIGGTNQPR